ncbi:3-oxoacyl-[acyl-carrier-protein] reductase [Microbispora corallina]|uniref:Beta-ketoacyl-ACP reductase n=1 Tax=Microbispora corallina TaxID=83302 RepID=A0ABQ4FUX6_9ACTN|nr:SDR family oxidoreductase [Microbispora corallina]GIH38508.1 beta-ketoacyl-ACP reductase [Microbispora corallina]
MTGREGRTGKVALVTGASRGIGAATARELGGRGYHVIADYRRDEAAALAVVADVEAAGGTARAVRADVCDPGEVAALVAACERVDVLVCNANIQPPFAALADLSWEDFAGKVTRELAAVFHVTKAVLEVMRGQGGGRIVYVSSISADAVGPGTIAHSTAKAALEMFAQHVTAEAGPHGIGVAVVAPGAVRTDATAGLMSPEFEARWGRRSVLGRMLEPEDVATVIASVADGGFHAVSGARITVDGGQRFIAAPR